jgi:hypothetical protein
MKRDKLHILLLSILALMMTGCVHRWPPRIIGERKNSQGEVIQQIVLKGIYFHYPGLTPEGPRDGTWSSCKYYFLEKGEPERELLVGNSRTNKVLQICLPVTNSDLWVTYRDDMVWTNRPIAAHTSVDLQGRPYTSYIANDLHVYVFDDKGYLLHRTFMTVQRGESFKYTGEFPNSSWIETQNGNRLVAFQALDGFKQYDVITDKVTNLETNSAGQK